MITIRLELKDINGRYAIEEVISSLGGFFIQKPGEETPCDILIMEVGANPEKDFALASNFQTSGIAKEVFLTSSITNPEILIEALKIGVKGFFTQPINKEDVTKSLLKFKRQQESIKASISPGKKGKIIDVFGCKGGVGTTTIAVNLAVSLAELEDAPSVALMDMNRILGEVSQFLNTDKTFNWGELASNINRLDKTLLTSILQKHSSGVHVIPSPVKMSDDYTPNPVFLQALIELMQTMFDYIVIDSGQFIDAGSRLIMRLADKVLFVLILSVACINNYKKINDALLDHGYTCATNSEIIVSRYVENSPISIKDMETVLGKKVLCSIPNQYHLVSSAINQGKPIRDINDHANIYKIFRTLASILSGKPEKEKVRGSLFGLKFF